MSGMAVFIKEIADGSTVTYHHVFISPFITQNLSQQTIAATTRISFKAVIGAHHLFYIRFLYQVFKGRQISFPQIAGRNILRIEIMAFGFRTAMHGIVFGTGMKFVIFGIGRPLQPINDCNSHTAGQVRIFPIGLLSASPTRVTEDIHVRCPKSQSLTTYPSAAFPMCIMIFGTGLITDNRKHIFYQLIIKSGSHSHCNGKYRSYSGTGYSVQRLVPPVVMGNTQPLHRERFVLHQPYFFFQSQPPQ